MSEQKARYEIIMAGSGGQGLVLAGIMLGEAAMLDGKVVAQTQTYEAASRGGFSMAEVIIDREEIVYQQVQNPDIVLALTEESMAKYAPAAERGVPVFYDTTLVKARAGISMAGYPFTQIASDRGNVSAVNILALGAMIARIPMVKMESLAAVIRKRFAGKALETNIAMLEKGAELIRGSAG
ncbi:MAG: 2-oxoacid:acceptor oxidoreductase family protein [Syntrophales bacterium]